MISNLIVDGKTINLALWDTAGQEGLIFKILFNNFVDYDALRPLGMCLKKNFYT